MAGMHNISEYIEVFEKLGILVEKSVDEDKQIRYISYNSQDIKLNTLFVCKGAHFKDQYLADAKEKGACVYVAEKKFDVEMPYVIVSDIRKAISYIADLYYGQVWEKINLIGITGTKGKSSTTYFMKSILDEYAKSIKMPQTAVVSGIDNYDGVISEESHLTTPEAFELQMHFDNAVKSGIEYLSMEVSSQALKYGRTECITYDIGAFLNIGEDHISGIEHPDYDDYFFSKLKLFEQCKTAVVNLNTDREAEVVEASKKAPRVITFGVDREDADIYGYDVTATRTGVKFRAKCDSFDEEFKLSLRGLFNADNALAAIAISYALNIPIEAMKAGLKKAAVPGRMEVFTNEPKNIDVIVDYAHNKMSFESLFQSTKKEYPDRKVFIVYGCPGKKAFARRRELAEVASVYADMIYITEEDAGEEDVLKISQEIAEHAEAAGAKWEIIVDRGEAIRRSIEDAGSDTVILITGKGRETRQKRGTKYIDTPSDVDYVREYL